MSEWRLIETAPKDGTTVDLWLEHARGQRATDCRWQKTDDEPEGAWCEWSDTWDEMIPINCDATHWMPLPESPK